jgi:hypothetical protein
MAFAWAGGGNKPGEDRPSGIGFDDAPRDRYDSLDPGGCATRSPPRTALHVATQLDAGAPRPPVPKRLTGPFLRPFWKRHGFSLSADPWKGLPMRPPDFLQAGPLHAGVQRHGGRAAAATAVGRVGSVLRTWPHVTIAAMAARMIGRPVRVELTRRQFFTFSGARPKTEQRVRIGTDHVGKLTALIQEACGGQTSTDEEYAEVTCDLFLSELALPTTHQIQASGKTNGRRYFTDFRSCRQPRLH